MKPNPSKSLALVAAGCLSLPLGSQAATKIDSSTITVISSSDLTADRAASLTLNGETNGTSTPQIFPDPVGSPSNPADWRQDATAEPNDEFGRGTTWFPRHNIGVAIADQWIIFDLGADIELETMNLFPAAIQTVSNNTNRSIRDAKIYYATDASGIGTNVHTPDPWTSPQATFDASTFDLLETRTGDPGAGGNEFTRPAVDDPAILPQPVDFTGITARYVAIDVDSNWGHGSIVGIGEVQFFTPSLGVDDPVLGIDPGTAHTDYSFGNVFAGSPAPTRTITFLAESDSASETVTIDSITLTDDGGGEFTLVSPPSTPLVLNDGETFSVEIQSNAVAAGDISGSLQILTTSSGGIVAADFNDKLLPLDATVFGSGEKLNPNPLMETNISEWDNINANNSDGGIHVSPGLSGGSNGMARVPGIGDATSTDFSTINHPSSFMQSTGVPNGASNWQLSAFFTPIMAASAVDDAAAAANFVSYADADGSAALTGADGEFTDRTFQLVVLSADTGRPFPDFTDGQAAGTLINIAYMPAGIQGSAVPDFYVFDGSTGLWAPTGIGAIEGSLDFDADADPLTGTGDGILDPSPGSMDVINAYRILVTGTGFGTGSASYSITVSKFSGADTFTTGTASGLTAFHGTSGTTGTPAGYSFITSDISDGTGGNANLGSNKGDGTFPGFQPPFWVDDVCFFNAVGPDPSFTQLNSPQLVAVENPATSGTTSFSIRNDGTTTNLDVTPAAFPAGSGFSITSPVGAFSLIPGEKVDILIEWDSTATSETFENQVLNLTTSDTNNASVDIELNAGIATPHTKILANWDFETDGATPPTDSFADWGEEKSTDNSNGLSENVIGVPGLITGDGLQAAYFGAAGSAVAPFTSSGGAALSQVPTTEVNNFELTLDFAVKAGSRKFNVLFESLGGATPTQVNLNYQGGTWNVFSDVAPSNLGAFVTVLSGVTLTDSVDLDGNGSLDDPGDTKVTYKLKVTGTGWGTSTPSCSIEVQDSSGTPIGSSGNFGIWRNNIPTDGTSRLNNVFFSSEFGNSPGFWVDNVCLDGQVLDTVIAPPAAFSITAFSIDKSTGMGSVTFSPTTAGATYELRASNDVGVTDPYSANLIMSDLGTAGETTFSFTDAAAPAQPVRTYRIEDAP